MLIRFFDIFFSLLALICLLPLFVPIVIILLTTGEREVFYKQKRVGYHKKHFSLLKFATMLKDSPSIGAGEITLKDDPRVLPFGHFLRKTKINELPQLINIILGHISIVGPRPMVPNTFQKYSVEAQLELSKVKPGLTGVGSIIFRDEEKFLEGESNPQEFYDNFIIPYKKDLEIWFTKNASLKTYFMIIFLTGWVIFFSSSRLPHQFLKGLPSPPVQLQR